MIKRVRKSFLKITMTMFTLMLIIPIASLNIITAALTYSNNKDLLKQIAQTEVYILDPKKNPPREIPPDENNNVGIVKQQHTTSSSTTLTTTVTSVETSSSSSSAADTTAKNGSSNNAKTTTAPNKNTTMRTTTTTTVPGFRPPPGNTYTFTVPQPPFHGDWTRPTDFTRPNEPPERPTRPQFDPDDWDDSDDYDYDDDYWYNYYGAVMLSPQNAKIAGLLALDISSASLESTASAASTTTVSSTTTFTTVKSRTIQGKVFNKDFKGHEPVNMNSSNSIDHFIVYLDKNDQVTEVHGTDNYTIESCSQLISSIGEKSRYEGLYNTFQYVRKDYSDGAIVVISDRQSDFEMIKNLILVSLGVFIIMEGIVFILTRILTKRAMRPMQISYEKQQQFISDAGHELKTPLTVISANADILADEIGENKWLSYIQSQTERMRILVQEMLDLTKIANTGQDIPKCRFNLSSLVENVALPFECQAFEQKKSFHIELEPDVEFFGNTERIRRMVGIFIDNAFKYSDENGTVKIQLKSEGGKKILTVYNTGQGIKKGEEEKIFERFYRSDTSRSSQGSYGLGLAIAKSIADLHNIKIQVQTEPGQWISFNLTF